MILQISIFLEIIFIKWLRGHRTDLAQMLLNQMLDYYKIHDTNWQRGKHATTALALPVFTAKFNLSPSVYWIREANRRWSMALSSMGHSQASAQSLQSIAGDADRKISFVLHEPENESEGSSNATVSNLYFNLIIIF